MNKAIQCYLKARELHLMFTPSANKRACELFQEAISFDGDFYRAKGHLAYSNLQAWHYGWRTIDLTSEVLEFAWGALYPNPYPDKSKTHAGESDYDNWWSVGVALLYYAAHSTDQASRTDVFNMSIDYYETARKMAWSDENNSPTQADAVKEDIADLLTDYAEALYFRSYQGDVKNAIVLLDKASVLHGTNYPKWHDWNRAWAYYEYGDELPAGSTDKEAYYLLAIAHLMSLPSFPNMYRRTIAACYAALNLESDARREGLEFLRHENARGRVYDPLTETRWPYRDVDKHNRFKERLRKAGIPAPLP
jgi:hypothetical protein